MSKLAVISALPDELKPLVDGWTALDPEIHGGTRGSKAWRGRIGTAECFAVSAGMGSAAAARACAIAESAAEGLDGMISLGWAGALSCGVHAARAYAVAEVVDAETGERFASSFAPSGAPHLTLITLGHVAQAQEKRTLAETYRAVLVDMESATVARAAQQKGIEFYCFKAVSDAEGERLPDFGRYVDGEGQIRMAALFAHLLRQPRYWPAMARMGKNTKSGAAALAAALREFLEKHADHTRQR